MTSNLESLREMVTALHGAEAVYWERRLDEMAQQVEQIVREWNAAGLDPGEPPKK